MAYSAEAARRYARLYGPGTYDTWLWTIEQEVLVGLVREHLAERLARARLLDFACGSGRVLACLEPMVAEATGVDVSLPMLELARGRVRKAALICADITQTDVLPAHRYGLVTAFRFFLNAGDVLRERALAAIRRTLASDGILIANLHANPLSPRLPGYLFRRYVQRREMAVLSLWQMKRLLTRHGFEVIDLAGVGWITPQMHRRLGTRWCGRIEHVLGRMPWLACTAGDLIVVCRNAGGGAP
jgi:SAM-dependent methyltransferase